MSRPSSLDVLFVDFDGVRFHLSTPEKKTVIQLSMNIRCWDELVAYGAMQILQREYGPLIKQQTEPEYNISLDIDIDQVPADEGACGFTVCLSDSSGVHRKQRSIREIYLIIQAERSSRAIRARL
jgi:hypothetical protein